MGWWTSLKRALVLLVVAAVPAAQGHGWLDQPASRNKQRNIPIGEPQSLPAGGPGLVYADGRRWPNGRHGLCGEPYKSTGGAVGPGDLSEGGRYATPPIIAARYAAGQTIDISIRVTAFHKGRFSFSLCKDPKRFSQACLDEHKLVNADGGGLFYYPPGGDGQIPPGGAFKMRFKLPAGVTCDRCVLQWYWLTGNSCVPPGDPRGDKAQMGTCGVSNTPPEEFWNCADIAIGGGGGGGGGGSPKPNAIKAPKVKAPKVKAPKVKAPKVKTPKVKTPKAPVPANTVTPIQYVVTPERPPPVVVEPVVVEPVVVEQPVVVEHIVVEPVVVEHKRARPPSTARPSPPQYFTDLAVAGGVTGGSLLLVSALLLVSIPVVVALLVGLVPGAIALVVYFAVLRRRRESFSQADFEDRLSRLRTADCPDCPASPPKMPRRRLSVAAETAAFAADAAGAYVLPAPLYHAARHAAARRFS